MPTYIFECFLEDGGCGTEYEQRLSLSELDTYKPKCPACKKRKCVKRNLLAELDNVYFTHGQPQTLGALAEKNTSRLSKDERAAINRKNNEYREAPLERDALPEGASYFPVDASGKRIPSSHQSSKSPKKKKNVRNLSTKKRPS